MAPAAAAAAASTVVELPSGSKQVLLARHTSEFVSSDDFQVVEDARTKVELKPGDVLLRNLWFSADPWYRICMHEKMQGLYMPPFKTCEPFLMVAIAKVVASQNPDFQPGDVVTGICTSSDYTVSVGGLDKFGMEYRKVNAHKHPLHQYLSVLGYPGFTAWVALVRIAGVKSGDEVFVSAASGGVGLAAGQIAKLRGCRVVGSAGSDEKVKALKEEFGFDDAFNYKTEPDWTSTLSKLFPKGIDVYVDNVGGKMLEAVLNNISFHARIAVSGMISQYNKDWKQAEGVRNLMNLVGRYAKMEGFLAGHHFSHLGSFMEEMEAAMEQGKIVYRDTITDGIDNFPAAFVEMMQGRNVGKALVHVADE